MRNFVSIFTLGLFIAFFSCNDDSIDSMITTPVPSNESVSGTAFFDRDGDGIGEEPMNGSRVFLGDSLAISSANDSIIFITGIRTEVDEFGNYAFEGVIPAENQAIRILPIGPYESLVGVDNIEDGDLNETLDNELIQISIEEDESDDGNDFIAFQPAPVISVSGYVLEDVDEDLIGDSPSNNHRIVLHQRSANGEPITPGFRNANTDENGYYEFTNVSNGEYIISHVGTEAYETRCVSSEDQSQEVGEPDADVECFIPVNLNDTVTEDHDNVFVVENTDVISVSGYVLEDTDGDLEGDKPSFDHIMVLFERDGNGLAGNPVQSTHSDENGFYGFSNIPNGEYVIQHTGTPAYQHSCVSNMDQSQEVGEPNADVNCSFIPVNLNDEVTEDHDNIFVIEKAEGLISGYVLEDIDGDLIGDLPTINHRIELYARNLSGVPTNDLVDAASTNENGYYEFRNIPSGDYVIYHIGTGAYQYTCVSNMDQSQEAGEPDADVECFFIPVNLDDAVTEDNDNVFVIERAPVNTISGYVLEDIDGDLIGDLPSKDHHITLQERDASGQPTNISGFIRISDENGFFEFTNIPNGEYVLQQIGVSGYMHICVSSMDQSQEVGEPDAIFDCLLPVNLDDTLTEDNDNVFVVEKPGNLSISGYVLEDVDGDLVGDSPSNNHLVKLYERNTNGEPVGDAIASIRSGLSGYYEFRNIPNGEYVLNHIGTEIYSFRCVANMDQSQEAGEPDADVECFFIPVNLNDMVPEDNDNVFVIERT